MNQYYQHPNNFSHSSQKQTLPTNGTPFILHAWADRIQLFGKICLWLIIGLGAIQLIASMFLGSAASNNFILQLLADNDEVGLIITYSIFTTLLTYGIFALIEYTCYNFISLVLHGLATIIENSNCTNLENNAIKPNKNKVKTNNLSDNKKSDNIKTTPVAPKETQVFNDIACPVCNNEFSLPEDITDFRCPICGANFDVADCTRKFFKCDICGNETTNISRCKINDAYGWADVCKDCKEQNQL